MDKNKLSPMMEHYFSIKKDYPDTIILYRLGDFYEMFFDDAVTASKILDLTLTGRDCGLEERAPMCGVPYHAVDNYISRLINSGKKVAICEQLTNPGDQKGMVKRDIIRVITPGTVTDENMLDATSNNYLASVVFDNNGFAVAWADITTGELSCKQFDNTDISVLTDFLLCLSPSEIIATRELCVKMNLRNEVIGGKLVGFSPYYDYAFDFDNAKRNILAKFRSFGLESFGLEKKFLAVQAVGSLLDYVLNTQKRDLSNISTVKYVVDKDFMYLDYNTKRNLELTERQSDGQKQGSLIWVLDRTKTGMGARHLRSWVLNPLQNVVAINERQEGIAELFKKTALRSTLGSVLSKIKDIERLILKISYQTIMPRDMLVLRDSLGQLPTVKKLLDGAKSEILKGICSGINPLEEIYQRINSSIVEEAPALTKDGGFIKAAYNEELDRIRDIHNNSTAFLRQFEEEQRVRTNISKLKVAYNRVFGYYIEVPNSQKTSNLPFDYVRRQTVATGERYTCAELQKIENEILGSTDKIIDIENGILNELRNYLLNYVDSLKKDAQNIAVLDCLYSLSEVAVDNDYVMPRFVNTDEIKIVDGRHPVVEAILKSKTFVPNDTLLNSKDSSTLILTGPNMAGKSTYIRQVALIVLMAHIGSFVPAKKVELSLVDRIFTRVGASDNLSQGQSTFMVEMLEVANILNNATSKSLLILDEIGRGTSTLDGLSIAWAIVEHIVLKIRAKTLFATHYHELSELEQLLHGVANYRILVQENTDGIAFLYKIARGGANKSFGIEVAAIAGVNKAVINRAKNILATLSENHELSGNLKEKMSANPTETAVIADQMSLFGEDERFSEIKKILLDTDVNRCTPIEALTILSDLKKILNKKA